MNLQRLGNALRSNSAELLDASEIDSLAETLSEACLNEPQFVHMVPDDRARRAVLRLLFPAVVRAAERNGEIHTTENADSVAIWIRPEHNLTFGQLMRRELTPSPFSQAWEFMARYANLCAEIEFARKRVSPGAHWYLMVLGTAVSREQQEIRDSLIAPVLSRADPAGIPCYLETFNEHKLSFYTECGFHIVGAGRVADGGPSFWAMTRTAPKS